MSEQPRTLTDADIAALKIALQSDHSCRFNNITPEDMNFIKDLLTVYRETRSEVIKWVVKLIVYLSLLGIFCLAYLKLGGKH